ncbi:MAG: lysozyme inhibitor LprI family protein [Beijerinckiaceae bacterium]
MRRLVFAALFASAAALPASAQTTPTDCARGASPIAKAICADPELIELDKALAKAFTAARGRVDSDSLKSLEKDQKAFLDERQLVLDRKGMPLAEYLRHRLAFLERLESPKWGRDVSAFVGTWRNSLGEVRIEKDSGSGRLVVAISTISPAESNWICDVESLSDAPKNGRLTFTEDEVKVTLARRGSALVVGDQVPEGDGGRPFCGANGYIDGAFFKMK